jgi:hypothetical protein
MAQTNQLETPTEREARLAHERALLEEGYAAYRAGRFIRGEALDEWLAALAGDGELPSLEELHEKYGSPKPTVDC